MKTLYSIMVVLIGVGIGGFFPAAAQIAPVVQTEGTATAPGPDRQPRTLLPDHTLTEGIRPHRARPDAAVQFESEAPRKTAPEQRRDEALRLHQNTLDRFQNADSSGQMLLSFSGGGVDLTLRSITGAEAPVATVKPRDK